MWSCETGECLQSFPHRGPVRGVAWSDDNRMFATISDPFVDHNAKISVFDGDHPDGSVAPVLEIDIPKEQQKRVNATNVKWTHLNEHLLVAFDSGMIRLYNPETGDMEEEFRAHEKKINRLQFNLDKTMFITSSADFTARLYDAVNLEHLKTYKTDRPVNDAVISEHKDHILLGGGQEAMSVTTTSGKVGKFETRFFWLVYEEEFGTVKGHFGPINACKWPHDDWLRDCFLGGVFDRNVLVLCKYFYDQWTTLVYVCLIGGPHVFAKYLSRTRIGRCIPHIPKVRSRIIYLYAHESHPVPFLSNPLQPIHLVPVAINPNGRNYASGAEDGYVRLHFFDKSYLDMKDPVPEADEEVEEGAAEAGGGHGQ
jgi:WD40 repeat protein